MATSWTPSSDGMPFYVRIADLRQREGDADFLFDTVRTSGFSIAYALITEFRTVVRGGLLPAMDLHSSQHDWLARKNSIRFENRKSPR